MVSRREEIILKEKALRDELLSLREELKTIDSIETEKRQTALVGKCYQRTSGWASESDCNHFNYFLICDANKERNFNLESLQLSWYTDKGKKKDFSLAQINKDTMFHPNNDYDSDTITEITREEFDQHYETLLYHFNTLL